MKRFRKLALILLVLLLVAGHVLYWYAPRERAAAPEPGSLPARLLAADAYQACLWTPYPHQNLGVLRGKLKDGAAWVSAVARVADLPPPVLPSFGPFTLPPSHEIAACSDLSGDRFLLVANVYPALAAVARLSGRLADNPWLAGGEIREVRGEGDQVRERIVRVAWREGMWTVSAGEVPSLEEEGPSNPAARIYPENLGIFRLNQDISDFPTGDYLLRRQGEDLEAALDREGPEGTVPELPPDVRPVLLAVAGASWPAAEPRPLPPAGLVLFDVGEGEGGEEKGPSFGPFGSVPAMAVFHPPRAQRWELPTEGIAGLLTGALPKGNAAGWRIVAVDAASLKQAKALAPRLSALTPPDGGGAPGDGGRLVLGLWVRPRPAVRLVSRVRKFLEKVPIAEPRQVQRWRDWETLLRPLAVCDRVSLTATQAPPSFRLRIHGCSGHGL